MTTDSRNSFFTASLLFHSSRNGEFSPGNLWEESIVLIEALTPYEAMEKATRLGESRKVSYQTARGEKLVWEFFKVERVFEIEEGLLIDGTELFSRHLRNAEVESLLKPFDDDQRQG